MQPQVRACVTVCAFAFHGIGLKHVQVLWTYLSASFVGSEQAPTEQLPGFLLLLLERMSLTGTVLH